MVFKSARVLQNEQSLWQFLGDFHVLPFDSAAAIEFGRIKAELKKLGRPIPAVDAQIAAIARSAKLIVLTADGHFSSVQGLTTENWLA